MSQESLSMRKIEEILRLKYDIGLSHRAIAKSCGVSTSTVSEYVTHAKAVLLRTLENEDVFIPYDLIASARLEVEF